LASAGFKISRTKLASLISAGDVRVNWAPVLKNGVTLKSGDVVSVSGMGRLKDEEKVPWHRLKPFFVERLAFKGSQEGMYSSLCAPRPICYGFFLSFFG